MKKTINILHISPDFNYSCGVSKYVRDLLTGLNNIKGVKLFFITNGGDAIESLSAINVEVVKMNFTRGIKNLLYKTKNISDITRYCSERRIDIIHTHHRYPEYIANKIAVKLNIKTLTTVHSLVNKYKRISFKSDKIIAISKTVKSHLENEYNIDPGKIAQKYNCIDKAISTAANDREKLRKSLKIENDFKIVLFAGRISAKKGISTLIKAVDSINKEGTKLKLILAGDIIDRKFMTVKKNNNIVYLPPIKDIGSIYNLCDCVVLPSIQESFPYVMLEAGLWRKPFIGTDIPGISEFIRDRESGLLFQPNNVKMLTECINEVLNDSDLAQKITDSNYNRVINLPDCNEYINFISDLYFQIIES